MLVTAGTAAAAEPLVAGSCGATLKGEAGAPVSLNLASALGISGAPTISLGKAPEGTKTFSVPESDLLTYLGDIPLVGATLPDVCKVTVTGVNTAAKPVQEGAEKVRETVDKATKTVKDTVEDAVGAGPEPGPGGGGGGGDPESGDPDPDSGKDPGKQNADQIGSPNSAPYGSGVPGFASFPYSSFGALSGYASPAPYQNLSFDSAPSSGLRYGTGFDDYAPEFGMLGEDGSQQREKIANAGSADSLPTGGGNGVGLPVLIAVLALAGSSAGLVRTWVLRKAAVQA